MDPISVHSILHGFQYYRAWLLVLASGNVSLRFDIGGSGGFRDDPPLSGFVAPGLLC